MSGLTGVLRPELVEGFDAAVAMSFSETVSLTLWYGNGAVDFRTPQSSYAVSIK
ncbi:MAG TPA: hypothetical protein VK754_04300 [Propionibacteriaceae bacterium]|nr:hypothetical protein [Propionibacteriaceae bacterium]